MAEQTITITLPVSHVAVLSEAVNTFRQFLDDCVLDEIVDSSELSMDLIREATEERVNRLVAIVELDVKLQNLLTKSGA